MIIHTATLRRLSEAVTAYLREQSNDTYGAYLLDQATVAWGSPEVVASVTAELLRLRALQAAVGRWREAKAAYETAIVADPAGDGYAIRVGTAALDALAALDDAVKACEQ